MRKKKNVIYVGVDVGKLRLAVSAKRTSFSVPNTRAGLRRMRSRLRHMRSRLHFVYEASSLARPLETFLFDERFAQSRVMPYRVRSFARSLGRLAKTDAIDAAILARFGDHIRPGAAQKPQPLVVELQQVMRRRDQVVELLSIQKRQLHDLGDRSVREGTALLMFALANQADELEKRAMAIVESCPALFLKLQILCSVDGLAARTALKLLAEMPELGTISGRQASALAGLAPVNWESGVTDAPRKIFGGRAKVRSALYMPAMVATRRNKILKKFQGRLRRRGVPAKRAIVAVMRKLLVYINSLLRRERLVPGTVRVKPKAATKSVLYCLIPYLARLGLKAKSLPPEHINLVGTFLKSARPKRLSS